ncbi:MAG: MarR family transcriptional regulator [Candidatus Dormibacteria bacterium]
MDRILTAKVLAARLGTSVPRIHRAVAEGLAIPVSVSSRNALIFDPGAERVLRERWGALPSTLSSELTRPQTFALAALSRRPHGLRSARAVAVEAGLSPTAALRALKSLQSRGLIERQTHRVVRGEVVDIQVWEVSWRSLLWQRLATSVAGVVLPSPRRLLRSHRLTQVPGRLGHLFWDVNRESLRVVRHQEFVIRRILASDDGEAWAWLIDAYRPEEIRAAIASDRAIEGRRRPFANVLAAAS